MRHRAKTRCRDLWPGMAFELLELEEQRLLDIGLELEREGYDDYNWEKDLDDWHSRHFVNPDWGLADSPPFYPEESFDEADNYLDPYWD